MAGEGCDDFGSGSSHVSGSLGDDDGWSGIAVDGVKLQSLRLSDMQRLMSEALGAVRRDYALLPTMAAAAWVLPS